MLHFAIGPHRAVLPEHWDYVPTRSSPGAPGLVHWADPVKPWDDGYIAEQDRWLRGRANRGPTALRAGDQVFTMCRRVRFTVV